VKNNVALAREGRKRLLKILEEHDAELAISAPVVN
jgi:hypothetical protein